MECLLVPFGSREQLGAVELRRSVLRRPLGLDFTGEDLAAEVDQLHLVGMEEGQVVACLVLAPLGEEMKLRQMAVSADRQGAGLGRILVQFAEQVARDRGFARMSMHARETAIGFYVSLGYEVEGDQFEEVGIPHRRMVREL